MSRKIILELEDSVVVELQKIFQESKKINSEITFEQFLSEILSKYVTVKNKTNDLFTNSLKTMLENFDPSQLENLFSSMKNMDDMFSGFSEKNKNEKKDNKSEETNKSEENPIKKKS